MSEQVFDSEKVDIGPSLSPPKSDFVGYLLQRAVVHGPELIREILEETTADTRPAVWSVLLQALMAKPTLWPTYRDAGLLQAIVNTIVPHDRFHPAANDPHGNPYWCHSFRCFVFINRIVTGRHNQAPELHEPRNGPSLRWIRAKTPAILRTIRAHPDFCSQGDVPTQLRSDVTDFIWDTLMDSDLDQDLHIPIPEAVATSIILWASHDVMTSPTLGFFRTCVVLENVLERQMDQPFNLVDVKSYSEILDIFITISKQLDSSDRKTPEDRWEGYVLNLGIIVMMVEMDPSQDFRKTMLEKNIIQITLEILDNLDSLQDETIVQQAHYLTSFELKRIRWALPTLWSELIKLEAVVRTGRNVSKLSELIAGPLIGYIGRHLGEAAPYETIIGDLCHIARTHPCMARQMHDSVSSQLLIAQTSHITLPDSHHQSATQQHKEAIVCWQELSESIFRALEDAKNRCARCAKMKTAEGKALLVCNSCRLLRYCSRECQVA